MDKTFYGTIRSEANSPRPLGEYLSDLSTATKVATRLVQDKFVGALPSVWLGV
jgi:hypothetical protein